jgi:hypothetical protein
VDVIASVGGCTKAVTVESLAKTRTVDRYVVIIYDAIVASGRG